MIAVPAGIRTSTLTSFVNDSGFVISSTTLAISRDPRCRLGFFFSTRAITYSQTHSGLPNVPEKRDLNAREKLWDWRDVDRGIMSCKLSKNASPFSSRPPPGTCDNYCKQLNENVGVPAPYSTVMSALILRTRPGLRSLQPLAGVLFLYQEALLK